MVEKRLTLNIIGLNTTRSKHTWNYFYIKYELLIYSIGFAPPEIDDTRLRREWAGLWINGICEFSCIFPPNVTAKYSCG